MREDFDAYVWRGLKTAVELLVAGPDDIHERLRIAVNSQLSDLAIVTQYKLPGDLRARLTKIVTRARTADLTDDEASGLAKEIFRLWAEYEECRPSGSATR